MNIKKKIKERGWTMEKLAMAMGTSQPSISQIINGNPTISKLQEIANIIEIPLSELVADDTPEMGCFCPKCGTPLQITIKTK